jgi:hypothetical protein
MTSGEKAESARLRKNERMRRYRAAHPELVAQSKALYAANNREKIAVKQAEYYSDNKERLATYNANYRARQPEGHEADRSRRWYQANLERARDRGNRRDWKTAGCSEPTRPRPEVCEVCGRGNGARRLHLDHDHATGEFRGWLCMKCNVALGLLDDSITRLKALAAYLEEHS